MSPTSGYDEHVGLVLDEVSGERVTAHLDVADQHKQAAGSVHGGVYAALAGSMVAAGALSRAGVGKSVDGLADHTAFLHPVTAGSIHAVARPLHQGRTTALWEVEMTDEAGTLCVLARVTLAIREAA